MKDKEQSFVKATCNFVFGCVATFFSAWVVTMLWGWFAVATFGLPALSIMAVFGLEILVNTFMFNPYKWTFNEKESSQASAEIIGVSGLALVVGFLIHLCM